MSLTAKSFKNPDPEEGTDSSAITNSPAASRKVSTTRRLLAILERYALVLLLIILILVFVFDPATSGTFPTLGNIRNVVANESVLAIAAFAALIPLVAERFDLSVGAIVGLTSIFMAKLTTQWNLPLIVGIIGGIALGLVIGLINGVIIAYFNANSLVITLGMATLLAGIGTWWTGDLTLQGVPSALTDFGNLYWLGIPRPAWLLIVLALVVAYLLGLTVWGRQLLSVGSNESAARLVGMPVARTILLSFAASGAIAGLAGVLLLARTGSASAGVGGSYTLPALAAIFLGSTTIRPGRFTVAGTLVGIFLVAVTVNGLTLAGAADWVEPVFNGAAVIIAVSATAILARRREGTKR